MATNRDNPVLVYLYSRKNIVGSLLALVGLALFFTGVVGILWPVVVVGLYLVGALVTPSPKRLDLLGGMDMGDVKGLLNRQVDLVRDKVSDASYQKVLAIRETILGILPRLDKLGPGSQDAFVVARTATDYLPSTLQSYLSLPRAYATLHTLPDGRTSAQALLDQLTLLDTKLEEVADAVNKNDTDRLLANGRFLEDRFAKSALTLPGQEDSSPREAGGGAGGG